MMRVDLDDLAAKARACVEHPPSTRVVSAPHRDGLFDVLTEPDGAEIYERCLLVDAEFAVAAQPAVVLALVDRIHALERLVDDACSEFDSTIESRARLLKAERVTRAKGVVLP